MVSSQTIKFSNDRHTHIEVGRFNNIDIIISEIVCQKWRWQQQIRHTEYLNKIEWLKIKDGLEFSDSNYINNHGYGLCTQDVLSFNSAFSFPAIQFCSKSFTRLQKFGQQFSFFLLNKFFFCFVHLLE